MSFFEFRNNGYFVRVKAMPNASCCACKGLINDADGQSYLKIAVQAVPEKGKANKELLNWLAKKLGIPKSYFAVVSGESDHFKKIFISSSQSAELEEVLNNLAEGQIK